MITIGIAVLVGLFIGGKSLIYATRHASTDDARVDADTVAITSKIAERVDRVLVDTNQIVHKGQILIILDNTDETTRLAEATANREAQSAQVQSAQANLQLTADTQTAQNQQNRGSIASAQENIADATASAASAHHQTTAANAALSQARAQKQIIESNVPNTTESLRRANADLRRTTELLRSGDVPQKALDADRAAQAQAQAADIQARENVTAAQTTITQAQAHYEAAIQNERAATAAIGSQRGQLTTAQGHLAESISPSKLAAQIAQYSAAQKQVSSLDTQVQAAREQLGYTIIRSPIDGFVGAKNIELGATVSPGQSLLDIVPNKNTYITANYKETQLGSIRMGQGVDVTVDAYPHTTFHGRVQTIAPAAQNSFSLISSSNATGNFVKVTQRVPVRIVVEEAPVNQPLRVGMSVETHIDISAN